MMLESILIVAIALILDFVFGDPKNRLHPTSLIGALVEKLVPWAKKFPNDEKRRGIALVVIVIIVVGAILVPLEVGINNIISHISFNIIALALSISISALLLKSTIAIKGMKEHAMAVVDAVERDNLDAARTNLAKIVKRKTKDLDKNHILSGVLESVSENTVDGVTGPLFYFALFGIPGAFIYRAINTIDSMIGYKTSLFKNVGWFGANCDKILNYLPARLTGIVMILGSMIRRNDWKNSYYIMKRDCRKLESPNAGYPMAALAGALGTRLEKIDHYTVGEGNLIITKSHIKSAIALMQVTSILFCVIFTIPVIVVLSYLGWWIHA